MKGTGVEGHALVLLLAMSSRVTFAHYPHEVTNFVTLSRNYNTSVVSRGTRNSVSATAAENMSSFGNRGVSMLSVFLTDASKRLFPVAEISPCLRLELA